MPTLVLEKGQKHKKLRWTEAEETNLAKPSDVRRQGDVQLPEKTS